MRTADKQILPTAILGNIVGIDPCHYAPAYIDSKDDLEIYKWKKTKTLEEMTMRVHRSELRFYPFSLTNKNEIPVKIVKELVTDGYAVMLISTVN